MDTFIEQIVAIKRTGKTWSAYLGIALVAIAFMTLIFYIPYTRGFFIVFDALIIYGVFKLYSLLYVEYEYIITNSTVDIDKIIAKSSRKRVVSFDLSAVQRIEKYNGMLPSDVTECTFVCNKDDEDAFILYYQKDAKPQKALVFAPNERTRNAMKGFLPHHLGENL